MIDEDLNVFLIEVNTNPCLDTRPCDLLERVISQVIDQTFKIGLDPFLRGRDMQYLLSSQMVTSPINYELILSNY
jgi:hypothetical protein